MTSRPDTETEALVELVLHALSWEAVDPDPASWGGERAAARDAVRSLRARLTEAEARVATLEAALERIATDARSAYGIAEQGGAKEMARAALAAQGSGRPEPPTVLPDPDIDLSTGQPTIRGSRRAAQGSGEDTKRRLTPEAQKQWNEMVGPYLGSSEDTA